MVKFKVNEIEYEMIDSWDDALLSQFIDINNLVNDQDNITSSRLTAKLISIISNCPEDVVMSMKSVDLNNITKTLIGFTTTKPKGKKVVAEKIDGVDYVYFDDYNNMTLDEHDSIEMLSRMSVENEEDPLYQYWYILSILVRPGYLQDGKWHQYPFNRNDINDRIEVFKKHMKAINAMYVIDFFMNGTKKLTKTTKSSPKSKPQLKKLK